MPSDNDDDDDDDDGDHHDDHGAARVQQPKTWHDVRELEFFKEQDKVYLPMREAIIGDLKTMQVKLKELMKINDERDDPNAKLKEHEFYLDLDELERLHKEADAQIIAVN